MSGIPVQWLVTSRLYVVRAALSTEAGLFSVSVTFIQRHRSATSLQFPHESIDFFLCRVEVEEPRTAAVTPIRFKSGWAARSPPQTAIPAASRTGTRSRGALFSITNENTEIRSLDSVGPGILRPFTSLSLDNAYPVRACSRSHRAFRPSDSKHLRAVARPSTPQFSRTDWNAFRQRAGRP